MEFVANEIIVIIKSVSKLQIDSWLSGVKPVAMFLIIQRNLRSMHTTIDIALN